MSKLSLALLLASAPTAAFATPDGGTEQRFVRDGRTFVYTVAQKGETQVIDGHEQETGRQFHYVVARNHVSGYIDQSAVEFDMPSSSGQLAAR